MKLIYCPKCGDVKKLTRRKMRYCTCEASFGQYEPDGWYAKIGGEAIALGINNHDLRYAVHFLLSKHEQHQIEAFVFPLEHPRIARIQEGTDENP